MIDHSGMSVSDFDCSKAFYVAALAPLGMSWQMTVPPEYTGGVKVGGMGPDRVTQGEVQTPPLHLAFAAQSRADVDAFSAAAIKAGAKDNRKPGLRPHYHAAYYGVFVLDADGNNVEAVCHGG